MVKAKPIIVASTQRSCGEIVAVSRTKAPNAITQIITALLSMCLQNGWVAMGEKTGPIASKSISIYRKHYKITHPEKNIKSSCNQSWAKRLIQKLNSSSFSISITVPVQAKEARPLRSIRNNKSLVAPHRSSREISRILPR